MTTCITDALLTEPDPIYRKQAKDNLSSHALADFRSCPRLFRDKQLGLIPDRDSAAYLLGRAAHTAIPEGTEVYADRYAVGGPINAKTGRPFGRDTKAFAEWAADIGKDVLSCDQDELVRTLAHAARHHPAVPSLLAEGQAEGVIRCAYAGIPCQGRFDWVSPEHGLVDLKTCDDLTWFESDARRFGYAYQMAFYRALIREATGVTVPVHLIAVEKREPNRCGVWRIADEVLDQAERENLAAMRRLEVCQQNDDWPTGYEDIRTFDYL